MSTMSLSNSLKRGIGRKIFGLFLLAGVLPVIFTAALAYYEFGRGSLSVARDELNTGAKSYGIDIISRLETSSDKAREIIHILNYQGPDAIAGHSYLLDDFEVIWRPGSTDVLHGDARNVVSIDGSMNNFLESGGTQLLFPPAGSGTALVMLRALGEEQKNAPIVAFKLDAARVWGPSENVLYNTEVCIRVSNGALLYCTNFSGLAEIPSEAESLSTRADGLFSWASGDDKYLASSWQLFLGAGFNAPGVDITASQPRAYALRSSADFRRVFVPALALVLLLVGILSFNAIGRSLVPLQYLMAAATQFAKGNLAARVKIRTDDEIGSLASAFNEMAGQLGQQIELLEAMSDIDRLILTGASIDEVSETVIEHLMKLTQCEAAAVIAAGEVSTNQVRMISRWEGRTSHDLIALPKEIGNDWYQPRQVSIDEIDERVAPYKKRFVEYGQKYVVIIPVVLNNDLKGILLTGSPTRVKMGKRSVQRYVDLAGRLAVALSSVEREDALYRQANFDELTGLPNRQLMKERLRGMIAQAREGQYAGSLLYLDLDRFKEINDVYGHSVGDMVLTQSAERITKEVRDSDFVSRLGGDEFVVVLPRVVDSRRVENLAARLVEKLTEEFSVLGTDHFVGVSVGVAMFPEDGDSVETLLKNADSAMYRAKEAGRARYEFFNIALNDESRRKIKLERDLRVAFSENKLKVYYQPQFLLSSSVISGAEALLRWNHPEYGYVSPAEFIPLAEESSLIVDIGRWVVERTCEDLRQILNEGLHPGPVSINVSARQLRDSGFLGDVMDSLQRHDIHAGFLQLEVTETTVAQNRDSAIEMLNAFRDHGVRVAIDDFGTGYSSLSYLQNMPFDVIKIDKSFVDLIGTDTSSNKICCTIIRMAHELGKTSIAEGVETREQADFLRKNDCDEVQGFFYSEALPLAKFIAFIRKQDFHTQRRKALEIV
jgi:diguanylate cyclase (GGDEF)-like protein